MPQTPDRQPGVREEEGLRFFDEGYGYPGRLGEIRYSNGNYYAKDAYGVFNIRLNVNTHVDTHLGDGSDTFYVISPNTPDENDDINDGYEVGYRWINTTDGYEYVLVDNSPGFAVWRNTTLGGGGGGIPGAHAFTHIYGGSDQIDGDKLDIDFTPSYYVPNTNPPEVDNTNELTAHLSGIDGYLSDLNDEKLDINNHKILRHLIHFIDEGPGDGFASGSTKQILPAGNPFPTQIIWKTADNKNLIIKTITRNNNQIPTEIKWEMYDSDGITILATITDTIQLSGVFEISRTRSIS